LDAYNAWRGGQFTDKVVTCHVWIGRRSWKDCRPETNVLATELRRQLFFYSEQSLTYRAGRGRRRAELSSTCRRWRT